MADKVEETLEGKIIRENFDELVRELIPNRGRLAGFCYSQGITLLSSDVGDILQSILDKVNSDETGETFQDFMDHISNHHGKQHLRQNLISDLIVEKFKPSGYPRLTSRKRRISHGNTVDDSERPILQRQDAIDESYLSQTSSSNSSSPHTPPASDTPPIAKSDKPDTPPPNGTPPASIAPPVSDKTELKLREHLESLPDVGEEEFIKQVEEEALNNSEISRKLAHGIFVGPTGSGKSSLMDRLLGRPRKQFSPSTGVAEPVVVVDVSMDNPSTFHSVTVIDKGTWKEIECNESFVRQMDRKKILRKASSLVVRSTNVTVTSNIVLAVPTDMPDTSSSASPSDIPIITPPAIPSSPPLGTPSADASITNASASDDAKMKPVTRATVRQMIRTTIKRCGGFEKFKRFLKESFTLYLRDTGGQVEFQEMIPLLVFGPSIFFFVFRLDLDFKKEFEVKYRKSAGESLNCYISSITTEEAFLQCLASVDAMDTPSIKTHQPLVFVIGTHRDKLGESAEEKIAELNSHLDSLISQSGFRDLVQFADRRKGQVMFTVDNTSESEEDFKLIRSKVNSMIIGREDFTIEYPIRYLLFCLELQSLKRSVLSFDECKVMAAKYGIEEDQLVHLLQFLHLRIGVIRYFDKDGVRHIVIKEPQVLFNKVTDLIIKTFSSEVLTDAEADNFEKKGILTASAFANVVSSRDGISPEEFLHLLVQLRITALFNEPGKKAKEKKYFIPSVLNHVPESSERRQTPILPLVIKFRCKHCPKGLFGVLVTHLMTPDLSEGATTTFTLMQDKIFKDQVSFEVRSPGVHDEMILRALTSHLEISLFPEHSEDRETPVSEVCSNVRQIVETSIYQSLQDLHYSRSRVAPVICFRCEDKDCSELHEVEILEKGKKLKIHCEKTRSSFIMPAEGQYWYGTG